MMMAWLAGKALISRIYSFYLLARTIRRGQVTVIYTNIINKYIYLIKQTQEVDIYIVHEATTPPEAGQISREACNEHLDFRGIAESKEAVEAEIARNRIKWQQSDLILVPAEFCNPSLIRIIYNADKDHADPYGISEF